MLAKIDWLSFSVKFSVPDGAGEREVIAAITDALQSLNVDLVSYLRGDSDTVWGNGRAPYKYSMSWRTNGVTLFYNPGVPHALVEISGRGCDELGQEGVLLWLLKDISQRLTRIDIACDMQTETRPSEFVSYREPGRFKSVSSAISESGETCYIGSRTSNRYARVYRYDGSHERAHLLRSEFVVKAEDAKNTAQYVLDYGVQAAAKELGTKFGWLHSDWKPDETIVGELKAYRPDRHIGKTMFWLNETVAAALVRLHNEGKLDAVQWFEEQIIPQLHNDWPSQLTMNLPGVDN